MLGADLPAVSGILLAGGRSSRFGRNKLEATLAGRPLVEHALESLSLAVGEVVIAIGPDQVPPAIPLGLPVPVRIARDPVAFEGPLVGLLAGLEESRAQRAIVLGADMPSVAPLLLTRLGAGLVRHDLDAVVLRDGTIPRPLPAALRVATSIPAARGLRDAGEGSLRALLAVLRVLELDESAWRDVDPAGEWLHDVDRAEDLPRRPV